MSTMRIIAGAWRSRRLSLPSQDTTRPMPDRVREAVFDILGSRLGVPGVLPPIGVADLFAGSGAMGLEALSRGAGYCVFVERDAAVRRILRQNLDSLQVGGATRILAADVWRQSGAGLPSPGGSLGLIFLDPPYRDSRDAGPRSRVGVLLARLARNAPLDPESVLVLHHEAAVRHEPDATQGWTLSDRREYGKTAISFLVRAPAEAAEVVRPDDSLCADDSLPGADD